jgi:hypothetical protein
MIGVVVDSCSEEAMHFELHDDYKNADIQPTL